MQLKKLEFEKQKRLTPTVVLNFVPMTSNSMKYEPYKLEAEHEQKAHLPMVQYQQKYQNVG